MDPGEFEVCSYCNRSIYPDVAECPYCHNYTDGNGPYGLHKQRRIPKVFVIAGWLVVIAFVLPALLALYQWLSH